MIEAANSSPNFSLFTGIQVETWLCLIVCFAQHQGFDIKSHLPLSSGGSCAVSSR